LRISVQKWDSKFVDVYTLPAYHKHMKHEVQHQLPPKPSMEESKRILQADQYGYTDEEVSVIIDFLYRLAAIDLNLYEELIKTNTQVIHIKEYNNDHSKKSIPISKSKYRRTG
jgi:hypothetical protein